MMKTRKSKGKTVTPSPTEAAGTVEPMSENPANVTIRVIQAHDGLSVGQTFVKPRGIASAMQKAGFWEIIK